MVTSYGSGPEPVILGLCSHMPAGLGEVVRWSGFTAPNWPAGRFLYRQKIFIKA